MALLALACGAPQNEREVSGTASPVQRHATDTVLAVSDTAEIAAEAQTVPVRVSRPIAAGQLAKLMAVEPACALHDSITKRKALAYSLGNDSLWVVTTFVSYDSTSSLHYEVYGHCFQRNDSGFFKALQFKSSTPGHGRDTVFDADFDGFGDFVVNYYSPVGCCPRESRDIYLNRGGRLLKKHVHTFNAGFDLQEKAVYQMGYGHPPWLEMTKSIWRADTLLEVEGIVHANTNYAPDDTAAYQSTGFILYDHLSNKEQEIDSVPLPYRSIYHWEWFAY